jgi:hypothetical protein
MSNYLKNGHEQSEMTKTTGDYVSFCAKPFSLSGGDFGTLKLFLDFCQVFMV